MSSILPKKLTEIVIYKIKTIHDLNNIIFQLYIVRIFIYKHNKSFLFWEHTHALKQIVLMLINSFMLNGLI